MVRSWTTLLGVREWACPKAGISHGHLAGNSTNNWDGRKGLRRKYICSVFFIAVFQDMNLSCSWGKFWLSALHECSFTICMANANQKATLQPECAPDEHWAPCFLKAMQFSEACTGSFCKEFKLGGSCLQGWPSKTRWESSWKSKQYYKVAMSGYLSLPSYV